MIRGDGRGQAGAVALKNHKREVIKENMISLKKALKYFKENSIPMIKTELAKEAKLSIATLNRSPYKEIIKDYFEFEKTLLSPNGRQEISELIKENKKLKAEISELKEKYKRLQKEITYSKELFS